MLTLARVLEIDAGNEVPADAIERSLGDRYLCRHDPQFAAIRARCVSLGYQFTSSGEIWQDYIACPLLCLQNIIRKRQIPYIDNISTLRRFIQANGSDFAANARFLIQILTPNHVLHESAHCVADDAFRTCGHTCAELDRHGWVMQALMGEAYANTVERIASVYAKSATHLFYLSLNSYLRPELDERDRLLHAVEELGMEAVFRATFLLYLVNNIACRAASEEEVRTIASVVADDSRGRTADLLIELSSHDVSLSQGFLEKTALAWFRLMGAEAAYESMRRQPLTGALLAAVHSHPAVSLLVRVALSRMEVPVCGAA